MTKFKLLGVAVILSTLVATPVFANESGVRPQADTIYGREVAAPPWSFACMNDQGPSQCGEPMWVYRAGGGRAGKKHDDWPANMILE